MASKKMIPKHCYYISDEAYDNLTTHEGRWTDIKVIHAFSQSHPQDKAGNPTKIKSNEFHISADFESGGWLIEGNLGLFEEWANDNGYDINNMHDEIPELEDDDEEDR
jgi:hypothetical protein